MSSLNIKFCIKLNILRYYSRVKEVTSYVRLRDILARVAEGENGRCHCRIAMEYIYVPIYYATLCILRLIAVSFLCLSKRNYSSNWPLAWVDFYFDIYWGLFFLIFFFTYKQERKCRKILITAELFVKIISSLFYL